MLHKLKEPAVERSAIVGCPIIHERTDASLFVKTLADLLKQATVNMR